MQCFSSNNIKLLVQVASHHSYLSMQNTENSPIDAVTLIKTIRWLAVHPWYVLLVVTAMAIMPTLYGIWCHNSSAKLVSALHERTTLISNARTSDERWQAYREALEIKKEIDYLKLAIPARFLISLENVPEFHPPRDHP